MDSLITVICFDERTKEISCNYWILYKLQILASEGMFKAKDGQTYQVKYYNDTAKVAFATLRLEDTTR